MAGGTWPFLWVGPCALAGLSSVGEATWSPGHSRSSRGGGSLWTPELAAFPPNLADRTSGGSCAPAVLVPGREGWRSPGSRMPPGRLQASGFLWLRGTPAGKVAIS